MSASTFVTSRDSKGPSPHIKGLFEVAFDNARLDGTQAQLIVEQGGMFQAEVTALLKDLGAKRTPEGSKRIQFEFSPDAVARMDQVKQVSGAKSYAEVVRNAIRLYEWFLGQEAAGNETGVVENGHLVKTVKFMF